MARFVWVATGVAWAFRSLLDLVSPHYYDAATPLDYLAVWSQTVALVLTGPAVVLLSRLSPLRSVRVVALAAAAGAMVAGLVNAAEDAMRVPVSGDLFVAGVFVLLAGLLACAVVLAIFRRRRLAAAFAVWSVGLLISTGVPGGGLLVLVTLVSVAVRPSWFAGAAESPEGDI